MFDHAAFDAAALLIFAEDYGAFVEEQLKSRHMRGKLRDELRDAASQAAAEAAEQRDQEFHRTVAKGGLPAVRAWGWRVLEVATGAGVKQVPSTPSARSSNASAYASASNASTVAPRHSASSTSTLGSVSSWLASDVGNDSPMFTRSNSAVPNAGATPLCLLDVEPLPEELVSRSKSAHATVAHAEADPWRPNKTLRPQPVAG